MKYLLVGINAKYIHSCPAIYSLKAYAGYYHPDADIHTAEYTINQRTEDVIKGIYSFQPDFIGISCYIWNIDMVMKVVGSLKKLLPKADIWLGGPEVSFNAKERMNGAEEIFGIMVGEGEKTFDELIDVYEKQKPFSAVAGIVYRNGNCVVSNSARECIDFSSVPFIYDDVRDFDNRIIYYESSRGCPFGCGYCLSAVEKKLRFRSLEQVKNELLFFLEHKVKQVKFIDRTFNCDHERTVEILYFIREHDNGITNFHFEIAGDILSEEEIEILSSLRKGLVQLEIGVQTTNADALEAVHRRTDMVTLSRNVRRLLSNDNIHLHLDLIAGLPYEDFDSFVNSFNEVYSMGGHELQLGFLKLLHGAPLADAADKYGILASAYPPYEVLRTRWISYDELLILKQTEEMLEIYHNSEQFRYSEAFILKYEKTPFDFYYNLSKYYEKKGYAVIQSSRMRKYEILFEYFKDEVSAEFKSEENKEVNILAEYLTCDYYERENAKSRPYFSANPDTRRIRAFYEDEDNREKYLSDYAMYSAKELQRITHLEIMNYIEEGKMALFDYSKGNVSFIAALQSN